MLIGEQQVFNRLQPETAWTAFQQLMKLRNGELIARFSPLF
jgi:hypothetical protein